MHYPASVRLDMISFTKQKIEDLRFNISRDELLRRGRILFIDDEEPDIIGDLRRAGFSVDYEADINDGNREMIERPTYDLIILDFGSVGSYFGSDEGLSLLRHIKRVNPSVVVFAYTSKALSAEYADFFRMTDGILPKDAGIADSMEKIEEGLRIAKDINRLWAGLLHAAGIAQNSRDDLEWQNLYVKGLSKPAKLAVLKSKLTGEVGIDLASKGGIIIFEKLVEAGAGWAFGA